MKAKNKVIKYKGLKYKRAGFTGLKSWMDSDMAADLMTDCQVAVAKVLKKELSQGQEETDFNTSGPVNVLLIMESLFKGAIEEYPSILAKVAQIALARTKKELASCQAKPGECDGEFVSGLKSLIARAHKRMNIAIPNAPATSQPSKGN